MRNKLYLLAGIAVLWTLTVSADVLIYRMVETNRKIGYDVNRPGSASGYLVFDWDSGEVRMIRSKIVGGSPQFTVTNPQGVRVYVAKGPYNSTYTVISRYQEKSAPYTEIFDVMYGLDSVLAIRPDRLVWSPKVLKGSPKEIAVPESDDDVILTLGTVTSYYLPTQTRAANAADQTADGVMERYRAIYLSKGYYEVPDTE